MTLRSDHSRWGALAQGFHWIIAALILVQGTIGLVMVQLPKRPDVIPVYNLHKSIGLTILALAVLRLAWRAFDRRPPDPPGMPTWQHRVSRLTHTALYVLIFAVPLSGWLFDSASSLRPLHWWGLLRIPSLTGGPAPALKAFSQDLHETLFWVLFAVAALHVAAALKHHWFDRDDVLRRMLPSRRRRAPPPEENVP
jgi:cytochrome b561